MKKVIIFESRYVGHHLKYVAYITEAFVEKGYKVIFATHPDSVKSDQYRHFLQSIEDQFEIKFIPIKSQPVSNALRIFVELINIVLVINRIKAHRIFLPWLDPGFYTLGLFGMIFLPWMRGKVEGILFRGDYAYPGKPLSFKRKLKRILAPNIIRFGFFKRVLFLDTLAYQFHKTANKSLLDKFSFCPECVEQASSELDARNLRITYQIPPDAMVLGSFGALDERKGTDLIVKAFAKVVHKKNCYLLLMGTIASGVSEILKKINDPRIIVVDRFVSDEELLAGIKASDVVAVVYPNHVGSSQILIRAATAQKPVLSSDYGVIGHITHKYNLGRTVHMNDDKEMARGISWAFGQPICNLELASKLAEKNTVDQFKKVTTRSVN